MELGGPLHEENRRQLAAIRYGPPWAWRGQLRLPFSDPGAQQNRPVFEPLRDVEYFRRFILDGWTVSWPSGADIAPETLHAYVGQDRVVA